MCGGSIVVTEAERNSVAGAGMVGFGSISWEIGWDLNDRQVLALCSGFLSSE